MTQEIAPKPKPQAPPWAHLVNQPWEPGGCAKVTRAALRTLGLNVPDGFLPADDSAVPWLMEQTPHRPAWRLVGDSAAALTEPGLVALLVNESGEHHVMAYVGSDMLLSSERDRPVRLVHRRTLDRLEPPLLVYKWETAPAADQPEAAQIDACAAPPPAPAPTATWEQEDEPE